jgi:glycosyltransferase involved in cell wall biosynthesis
VILGVGADRSRLEALARVTGVAERVRMPGSRPDARRIVGAADAVVACSRWEGLPLATMEALAAGRPVVATRVLGLDDLIEDGISGILVPAGDADALGAALARILGDDGLATRLGEGARARAARFSQENMIDAYLALYHDVADGRS